MRFLLKILIYPFSILFGFFTLFRNKIYDWKIFKSSTFDIPIICVGNISMGGTGKSPLIEYLLRLLLKNEIKVATLSRGYGRRTKGFLIATNKSTSRIIGDEPKQFFNKFQNICVAVCENRRLGIQNLLGSCTNVEVILLDDAFQHRRVIAGISILLSEYENLYTDDCMLPSGRLREFRNGATRAEIIIITKSPYNITESDKQSITKKLKPKPNQTVFFSHLKYNNPISFSNKNDFDFINPVDILLFTGIANPKPLESFLAKEYKIHTIIHFRDHHNYSTSDILQITEKFNNIVSENKIILTTEKDFVRLVDIEKFKKLNSLPIFYIPIEMDFGIEDKKIFDQIILNYARKN
ncbi:MAG: tetraacyldisaccharide 4'-kinase [Bacteroidota bacterium]